MSADAASQEQAPSPESAPLLDIIDRILDRGLVLDAWVRVPVAGLDVLTIEARMLVASWERYLQFADAVAQVPLTTLPAPPSAETAHVVGAMEAGPVEDDTALVGPGAATAAQVGGDAAGTSQLGL